MKLRYIVGLIFLLLCLFSIATRAQSVGLVLSGGGAKGLSHIGVIKALEENNIPIDYICGTSMGSIIGGLYAIGITPDEMLKLFNSHEFRSWQKGVPEDEYESYFYREEAKPNFMSLTFSKKIKKNKTLWTINLPTSLISSYPMDLAVMQIFAAANGAAKQDFSKLMIPFFCVAADIVKKKEYVMNSGDLGSAVRASMTFPFYFKPIMIDSTLLFDGGFYNNFPWELMDKEYSPDILIGSKCVTGDELMPEDDDILTQIETIFTTHTDYSIPPEKGVIIEEIYDYGLMDFENIEAIVEQGYKAALRYIPELKKRIEREESNSDLYERRLSFRKKWDALNFNNIKISGSINDDQRNYMSTVIRGTDSTDFSFTQMKRGYYRLVDSKGFKTIYPQAYKNSQDSLYTLYLRVTKSAPLRLSAGLSISSSALTQGYLGIEYSNIDKTSWKTSVDMYIGQFYSGISLDFRHNFSLNPLAFYKINSVFHTYDYYGASQRSFNTVDMTRSIRDQETFTTLIVGAPLSKNKNILAKFSLSGGYTSLYYFNTETYSPAYDDPDTTRYWAFSPRFSLERNTINYPIYATKGKIQSLSFRYSYGMFTHLSGSTSSEDIDLGATDEIFNDLRIRLKSETYYNISKWFDIGLYIDLSIAPEIDMGAYKASLLYRPAFEPFPHAETMILDNYRASTFIGVALNPVFKLKETIMLHTTIGFFQPYKTLVEGSKGVYEYSTPFKLGGFVGNIAAVWQSPIGPISVSSSYYEKSDVKWFFQFNLGLLLFKNKFIRD